MNRATSIAENCRSILRDRCCTLTNGCVTYPQQDCSPALIGYQQRLACQPQSFSNGCSIDGSLAPMQPILNKQTSHVQYVSIPSGECIQMITNAIVTRVQARVSYEDLRLLCCCLPSLIRQIMCKSPWLTPNDVIQWLTADILKEAMKVWEEDHPSNQTRVDQNRADDHYSNKSPDSLSSHRSRNSQESILSRQSSRSNLRSAKTNQRSRPDTPLSSTKSRQRSQKEENTPSSTRSYRRQQDDDSQSNTFSSATLSPRGNNNSKKRVDDDIEQDDQRSVSTRSRRTLLRESSPVSSESGSHTSMKTFNSRKNFDQPSPRSKQSPRVRLEFPGKKDPQALQDVEKCLAFYQKVREYFDEDVAAMLLKCCLCYGQCSGNK